MSDSLHIFLAPCDFLGTTFRLGAFGSNPFSEEIELAVLTKSDRSSSQPHSSLRVSVSP
jgi:hypothetical protein